MSSKRLTLFLSTALLLGTATAYSQITPSGITLGPSQQQQFSVPGQDQWSWSIVPTNVGTISPTGLYTAPAAYQSSYVYIYARSGSRYYQMEVQLSQGAILSAGTAKSVGISVSPSSIYLYGGQSAQFTASVSGGGNTQAMWSITQGVGSIVNGLYTAPSSVSSDSLVTILATSLADPTKSASATILLGPAITPAVTTPSVSIYLRPRYPLLKAGQTKQFNATVSGSSNTAVTWSLNPSVGTVNNGLYTAPTTISATKEVQITATSVADPTQSATSNITLIASVADAPASPPPPPPSTSVSPATTTVAPGGSGQFSVQNLPSGVTVAWSVSPTTGSIASSGLYTAPSTVASQQTLTVTAANSSTQAVLGTATLTLTATPPPPSVTPATATVAPTGTAQFIVQNLPSGSAVTWTVSPTTGSIASNGLYTAPSTVASQQTLTVTATNSSTQAVLGTASLTLTATPQAPSVSPATATVAPLGSQVFSMQNLPSGTTVKWSISPGTGTINGAGVYAAPGNVASQQTITVTAKNASTKAVLGTATITLTASPAPPPVTSITLPIEVVGPDGTTATTSFTIPQGSSLSGQLQLAMTIHGLRFDAQASVRVNNSAWLPISTGNVTLLGNAAAYGGIGGGFHTLQMTLNLPSGAVAAGNNTITFRFNGTDGRVSGFRVLAFNVQTAGGSPLISDSTFVYDDPNTWQPPSTLASDITAGQSLWRTAALTVPGSSGTTPIKAHCMDCHTQDGRDLRYFNYSNNSIRARSMFHGLSSAQGNQIASYIRSLNLPNPGRPWNPPYQPGPGLDSQPVDQWAAGAGLDAVLATDEDMVSQLFPSGPQASFFSPNGVLNVRETAITQQLPDWNSWLPTIHPMDAWPDFLASNFNLRYGTLRGELQAGDPVVYANSIPDFDNWGSSFDLFILPKIGSTAVWTPAYVNQVYSTALWAMVKNWELNQEFQLEGMARAVFPNPRAESRAWFSGFPFLSSPNMLHIPPASPGLDNGSLQTWTYLSFVWYHSQLILNNSEYQQNGNNPIDWGYVYGFIKNLSMNDSAPQAGLLNLWLTKGLQISNNGLGPDQYNTGWSWIVTDISREVSPGWRSVWTGMPPSTRSAIYNGIVQGWLTAVGQFTPAQFHAVGTVTATQVPKPGQPDSSNWVDRVWYMIPQFRYYGVNQTLINQMAAWAQTIWPNANWAATTTATCVSNDPTFAVCSTE